MGYQELRSIVRLRVYNLPKGDGHNAVSVTSDNALLAHHQGATGIKTGFTNSACHTLLFSRREVCHGRTLIGDALGSPITGFAAGAQDAARSVNWGFSLKQSP